MRKIVNSVICLLVWLGLLIGWGYRNYIFNESNAEVPLEVIWIILPYIGIVIAGIAWLVSERRWLFGWITLTLLIASVAVTPFWWGYWIVFGWPAIIGNSCLVAGALYQHLYPEIKLKRLYQVLMVLLVLFGLGLTNSQWTSRWVYAAISDPIKAMQASVTVQDDTAAATHPKIYSMADELGTKPASLDLDKFGPIYLYHTFRMD